MCLSTRMSPKKFKKFLPTLTVRKNGYITLWKVFCCSPAGYLTPAHQFYTFYQGKNTADTSRRIECAHNSTRYTSGFHCFTTRKAAEQWTKRYYGSENEVVQTVRVKKAWITAAGNDYHQQAVICKHIVV